MGHTLDDDKLGVIRPAPSSQSTGGGNLHDHLQSLQRSHGNQAVTLMVQRDRHKHHGGAASTDAPGHKATAGQPDFFPKDDVSPGLAARDISWLEYVAPLEFRNGSKQRAIKLYEELVFKQQRDISAVKKYAIPLHLSYASVDAPRSLYWMKVAKGEIVPQETKSNAELIKEMEQAEISGKGF